MTNNRFRAAEVSIGIGYHVGRKRAHKANQDNLGWHADIAPDKRHLARKGLLYIVADGMGGAAGGDLASRMAVELTLNKYYQDNELDVQKSLSKAVQAANEKIYERGHSDPASWGMGTTIVAAVIYRNELNMLNVGDSRAYLLRRKQIRQISTDHSLVQEQVRAGLITQEEAEVHPRRNVLSRNLGYAPEARPSFARATLRKRDMILLCSDGLWGQMSDEEMADMLQKHEPQVAADALVDLANERGGPDNISLMIIRVDKLFMTDEEQTTEEIPSVESTPTKSTKKKNKTRPNSVQQKNDTLVGSTGSFEALDSSQTNKSSPKTQTGINKRTQKTQTGTNRSAQKTQTRTNRSAQKTQTRTGAQQTQTDTTFRPRKTHNDTARMPALTPEQTAVSTKPLPTSSQSPKNRSLLQFLLIVIVLLLIVSLMLFGIMYMQP
ncbi:MAG: Stp1/IreP family PP2C-type Ser/Thr phosphatase [Ardenticatenaceae bacterium]